MLPAEGYSLAARQLLAAGSRAEVFGGIGSWNDVRFESPEVEAEYRSVSERLFRAVLEALVAATNSFDPSLAEQT